MNFLTPQQQMAMSMQQQPPVNPYNPMQGMDPSGFAPPGQLMNQQQPMFRPVPHVTRAFGLGSQVQQPSQPAVASFGGGTAPSFGGNNGAGENNITAGNTGNGSMAILGVDGKWHNSPTDPRIYTPPSQQPAAAAPVQAGGQMTASGPQALQPGSTGDDSLRQQIVAAMQQMQQTQQAQPAPASQPLIPRPTPVPTPAPTPAPTPEPQYYGSGPDGA